MNQWTDKAISIMTVIEMRDERDIEIFLVYHPLGMGCDDTDMMYDLYHLLCHDDDRDDR